MGSVLCSGQNIRKFLETTSCGTTMGYGKRWKAYSNDLGHLLLFIIVNPLGDGGGGGHLEGILPQIYPHSAGLLELKI